MPPPLQRRLAMSKVILPSERNDAERLIRTLALTLANGAPIKDVDELVRRNAGRLTQADIQSGRVNSNVLGDIINTVEQAKGHPAFNWLSVTPEQQAAYLRAHGIDPSAMGLGFTRYAALQSGGDGSGGGAQASASGTSTSNASGNANLANLQQAGVYGRMSGAEFANQLGYRGDQAREIGGLLANTSGGFRAAVADYKRVIDDPNSTEGQKEEARKHVRGAATNKGEKDKADGIIRAIDKMKRDGVDLNATGENCDEKICDYMNTHSDVDKALKADTVQQTAVRSALTARQTVDALDAAAKKNAALKSGGDKRLAPTAPLVSAKL